VEGGKGDTGALYHALDCIMTLPQRRIWPIVGDVVRRVEFVDCIKIAGVPDLEQAADDSLVAFD